MKIRIAIIGYGNIGKAVEQAVLAAEDMQLAGIYHHNDNLDSIDADLAALCTPTREVPAFAQKHGAVSVIAAGWDPGSDSVVRALLTAIAPKGITYTNFGPGRSMGHTVAAKTIPGVKDALSMTIPLGTGIHRRMVYVELEDSADFATVEKQLLADDYFAHDETHVIPVPSVDALNNVAHGVHLERSGVSGDTHNQRFEFNMEINNPALTGQVLVAVARAAMRIKEESRYGAYTLIEIPPIFLLPGNTENNIRNLV